MKQSAVEFLVNIVQSCIAPNFIPKEIVKQAKEMEKQQQERSYSKEEMRECYEFAIENVQLGRNGYEWVTFDEWFEQFKKK